MGCSQIITVGILGIHVDLVLIRSVDFSFSGMFSDPHCRYTRLQLDPVLIRLVDMGFSGIFSDPYCRYTGTTARFGFNQIGGWEFQWDVLKSSL